ncbi:diacylglycerol kinase [Aquabacterium sp. NJ1]|uniref:diacylglycerol kinase n=1 Tax=Aquabacterium sp. NJ1 TaxID=1538295 RepID=UPI00052DFF76|nr:diacylglycerol kinase [Aquabacterium sp. NJ1]KGM39507.1 diacylglycerol kinase [Aquabacterium sp. NJ1]
MKGHHFLDRLAYAWAGLRTAWRMEKSLRTHALATVGVLGLLLLTRAPGLWWAVMALTVGLVVATELLNTALEALCDHLHPQRHEAIKLTKDVAAAAVLVSSLAALIVGLAFVADQVLPWLGWIRR